jgi:hypothetical protein
MLSLILRRDFFLVWAKIYLEAFVTICWCQWRIFAVLGTLSTSFFVGQYLKHILAQCTVPEFKHSNGLH